MYYVSKSVYGYLTMRCVKEGYCVHTQCRICVLRVQNLKKKINGETFSNLH
jgi:hypothetical protein